MAAVKGVARRDKARATRLKILRAAQEEFVANGYHGATIAAIAKRAGVAAQTVYFVFHTKSELISAAIDLAVMGEESPEIPQESAWWAELEAASTAQEGLRAFVRGAAPIFARASSLSEIMRAAAITDEEVRATYQRHDELQRTAFAEAIDILGTKGRFRNGLTVDTATDLLMTLLGDAFYHQLTVERGWTHEAVVEWLTDTLPRVLLDD